MKTVEEMRNDYLEPENSNSEYLKMNDDELTESAREELAYYCFEDLLEMLSRKDRVQYQEMFNQLLDEAVEVAKDKLLKDGVL